MIKEGTDSKEGTKGPEKIDDFLQSLFRSLDRQKSKDDRKLVERKVVVRRLPPSMTEERFLNEVSPLPEFNYMYFVPGDVHDAPFHHSRVYINFLKEDDLFMFTNKFDGYVFVDDTGDEYPATVELAPYQRIPKKKLDKDPSWGKIHGNPVFLEFKHNFEQKTIDTNLKTTQHFFESVEDKSQEQDSSTPLLEYLAKQNDRHRVRINQREERRKKIFVKKQEKDEIRRNHKGEKEIFIKPKLISKNSPFNKRLIEEKPLKDTVQKKIIIKIYKDNKDSSDFVDEKKKYFEDNRKTNSEDPPKVDNVKKIEFKLKTTKLSSSNKCFDNDSKDDNQSKSEQFYEDNPRESYEIKKRTVTSKWEHSENKTSASWKHTNTRNKTHEDKSDNHRENSVKPDETENNKKYRPEADKKTAFSRRTEHSRQDTKTDRRIRNKDRPAIEIYRPGMGRLSKLKSDNDCDETEPKK